MTITTVNRNKNALLLKKAFDTYFEAPVSAWSDFADLCFECNFKKNELLKLPNTSERFMYFIVKGSMGLFVWKQNNFVCLDLGFENHFFCDYMSLLNGQATPLETMVLEDSKLLRITRSDFMQCGNSGIGLFLMRAAAEWNFISKQQQQINILTKTAEQRYHELIKGYPDIIKRVSQKHLASYLEITPQSFSRIRAKLR